MTFILEDGLKRGKQAKPTVKMDYFARCCAFLSVSASPVTQKKVVGCHFGLNLC